MKLRPFFFKKMWSSPVFWAVLIKFCFSGRTEHHSAWEQQKAIASSLLRLKGAKKTLISQSGTRGETTSAQRETQNSPPALYSALITICYGVNWMGVLVVLSNVPVDSRLEELETSKSRVKWFRLIPKICLWLLKPQVR